MVLRMMIGHFPERFGSEIQALSLSVCTSLVERWRLALQVHDDLVFIGPDETHLEMAQRTRAVMSQEWKELDGFHFRVETKYSTTTWGDGKVLELAA